MSASSSDSQKGERRRREQSWGLAVANQLALPGLGTVLAGRRFGFVQLFFSVVGVILVTAALVWMIPNLGDLFPRPQDDEAVLVIIEKWKPWVVVAVCGIMSYFMGWCLALGSSRSIVRKNRINRQPQ